MYALLYSTIPTDIDAAKLVGSIGGEMHIDIVTDVICPWCYIGKRRLERALALRSDLTVTRSWRAFQINPDMPTDGVGNELYLAAKFPDPKQMARLYARLTAAGRTEGIDFAFDLIRRVPNTLHAHRLIRLAAGHRRADQIAEALFRAYFMEGIDIGDIGELAAIAASAGLDADAALTYLSGEAGVAAVRAEDRRAKQLGIHSIPCFVLERGYTISGAQEPEVFLPLFDLAAGPGTHNAVAD